MSYERNNTMVACILAFIILGGVAVGAIFFLGTTNWAFPGIIPPNNWDEGELFEFDRTETSMPATVTLDIDVSAGAIMVVFEDDPNLLYNFSIWVPNNTLTEYGDPEVTYASDTIGLNYSAAGVNVTLGTGTTYVLDIGTATGAVSIVLENNASIGNINVDVTTGAISLIVTDDINISGNLSFDLTTTTGAIDAVVNLPTGVEGQFRGSTSIGAVDINGVGDWNEITDSHYQTSGFTSATNSINIVANTTTGAVDATLT
ncbi:MAG: hypothetical protein ACFFF4_13170 [Candidatus Thorarchaeota archaeon]